MELERFSPGVEGFIWYEHWHRYHFAVPLAAGRRVADVACGEGYGSALLAGSAQSVIGIDADPATVAHARRRYGSLPRVEYREGRCEALPLDDGSLDVLVSFETLEHVADPERLVAEAARVLAPDGVFVVSTPNKAVYSDARDYRNPFHVRELYREEFVAMIRGLFPHAAFWGQRVDTYSAIWPLDEAPARVRLLDARQDDPHGTAGGQLSGPMYFVAIASRDAGAVEAARSSFSLLGDREHRLAAARDAVHRERESLVAHVRRMEEAYAASQAQLAATAAERDRLAARVAELERQPTGWRTK